MRALIAGGVFSLGPERLAAQQPAPEVTLATGLAARGLDVTTCSLKEVGKIARGRGQDIVHVHHLSRGAVAGAASRKPFVFTSHSTKVPAKNRDRAALQLVMRRADAAVCLSERERSQKAAQFPRRASRLKVIANGIDFSAFQVAKRSLGVGEKFRLLYVGQLVEVKRVDRVLRALSANPEVELRLVYHNAQLEGKLRSLAGDFGITNRVTFVGALSGDALAQEYGNAHALALPSLSEALPSVVTEALSTGLPVLASDVGGIRGQCLEAGVLSDPTRDDGFAQSLNTALHTYEALSTRALLRAQEVRKTFSIQSMIDAHIELYEEILAR